eukprot:CAMPEP_0168357404 /NCGR_PEP_ID=MMETSP0228-20121227/568_1 /TAXON_ID=133427 /ORGANISM="Protoceratium reticulatum, Strain CCCM 535 (=CCMP 1889)" /LENGTH=68 /DNA_ID=CAMNT_0008369919 /DNA_START=526 /DNA_END=728 /DNA_ORIENTATION=+
MPASNRGWRSRDLNSLQCAMKEPSMEAVMADMSAPLRWLPTTITGTLPPEGPPQQETLPPTQLQAGVT